MNEEVTKYVLDSETKMELLIKLAFGIPISVLEEEYDLTKERIINLRKNNYIRYNEFVEHWKIDSEVAKLGLSPKYERALSIIKKFYKKRVSFTKDLDIFLDNRKCTLTDIIDIAHNILKKDDIHCFKILADNLKNHY